MKPITIIWLIFTILFLLFGVIHINASNQRIEPFKMKAKGSVAVIEGIPVNTGLKNFVSDFNSYIENQNKANKSQNWLAATGYLLASITSLISMFLTIDNYSDFLNKVLKRQVKEISTNN